MTHATNSSTWEYLVHVEHRLDDLLEKVRHSKATWENYERMKSFLDRLVGWGAEKESLRNSDCWELAVLHLWRSFPKGQNDEF